MAASQHTGNDHSTRPGVVQTINSPFSAPQPSHKPTTPSPATDNVKTLDIAKVLESVGPDTSTKTTTGGDVSFTFLSPKKQVEQLAETSHKVSDLSLWIPTLTLFHCNS